MIPRIYRYALQQFPEFPNSKSPHVPPNLFWNSNRTFIYIQKQIIIVKQVNAVKV